MVIIDTEKCVGCGACVKDCFRKSIVLENQKAVFRDKSCIACGHCIAVCPCEAVEIEGYDPAQIRTFRREEYGVDADTLLNFLKYRRSVRQFESAKIPEDLLNQILDAGRYAPTARNLQEISFAVIQEDMDAFRTLLWDQFERLIQSNLEHHIDMVNSVRHLENIKRYRENPTAENEILTFHAPAIIIILSDNAVQIPDTMKSFDAGLAAANMEHVVNALGLGAFHCGMLVAVGEEESIKKWIGIGDDKKIVMSLVLGYPAKTLHYFRSAPRRIKAIIRK